MIRYFAFSIILLISLENSAQSIGPSVISSSGETSIINELVVNWTIGEVVTGTVELNGRFKVNQGLHQSTLIITALEEDFLMNQVRIFPNPTADYITISIDQNEIKYINLFDLQGNLLEEQQYESTNQPHKIDLTQYKEGVYILTINTDQNTLQGKFKIVKTSVY